MENDQAFLEEQNAAPQAAEDTQTPAAPKSPKPRKKWSVKKIAAVVAVALVSFFVLKGIFGVASAKNAPVYVQTQAVEAATLTQQLSASGALSSGQVTPVNVPAELAGVPITKVLVENGDAVTKGQQIAAFDTADLSYGVQKAQAAYQQVVYANNDAYANADLLSSLQSQAATLEAEVNSKQAALAQLQAQGAQQSELDAAQAALAAAQQQLSAKQAEATAAGGYYLTQATRMQMAANAESARKALEDAKSALALATAGITAPTDGLVSGLALQEGGTAPAGTQALQINSLSDVQVAISLSKYEVDRVQVGQSAQVTVGSHTYSGKVVKIDRSTQGSDKTGAAAGAGAAASAASGSYIKAYVQLEGADEHIFLGLEASVDLITAEKQNVIAVPFTAVVNDNDGVYCYLYQDGRAVRRPVSTGISSDTQIEITEGLVSGDVVITNPGSVTDGQAVTNDPAAQKTSPAATQVMVG